MLISSSQYAIEFIITCLLKSLHTAFFLLITDEMKVNLQYFDGRPMSGTVPQRVTCTVVEAQPNTKGLTAQPQ